jgi:hypothetical protein
MLHAGLDLSRARLDVCLVGESGELVAHTAAPPDADGLRPAWDCDEGGPPRWDARRVTEERARGGPCSCCTLDWI